MFLRLDSLEYQCWHEVGHAVSCLHWGGDVEFIEFLDDNDTGRARTRCVVPPPFRSYVLCGGFAAEFVLFRGGYLEAIEEKDFIQIIFKNATIDRQNFFGKSRNEVLTVAEDKQFMNLAVKEVAPIIKKHFAAMCKIVTLLNSKMKVDGLDIKNVLERNKFLI